MMVLKSPLVGLLIGVGLVGSAAMTQGAVRQEEPQTVEQTFLPFTAGYDGDGAVTRQEYLSS